MGLAQAALFAKFTSATGAMASASDAQSKLGITAVNAKGQLEPMSSIIGQLHDKIQGMGTAQATATLSAMGFKNASAKLVETIQAGPVAYDKYVAAVQRKDAAEEAAKKATAGMKESFDKLTKPDRVTPPLHM